jgi:hypothetical protein
MYVCGWPPRPALILSPIEHFEITSQDTLCIPVVKFFSRLEQEQTIGDFKTGPRIQRF